MPPAKPPGPDWWREGIEGKLAPWAQAKVWALIAVSKELGLGLTDNQIAEKVVKVGGGSPKHVCIAKWRNVFDEDPLWYPGKPGKFKSPVSFNFPKNRGGAMHAHAWMPASPPTLVKEVGFDRYPLTLKTSTHSHP